MIHRTPTQVDYLDLNMFQEDIKKTAGLRILEHVHPDLDTIIDDTVTVAELKNEDLRIHSQLIKPALEELARSGSTLNRGQQRQDLVSLRNGTYRIQDPRKPHICHAEAVFDRLPTTEMSAWYVMRRADEYSLAENGGDREKIVDQANEIFEVHRTKQAIEQLVESGILRETDVGLIPKWRTVESDRIGYQEIEQSPFELLVEEFGYLS